MDKIKLSTDWICIATSGATVDGREISAKDVLDMAETYDPKEYTALIWAEHFRWSNYGQVLEVKAEEKDGQAKLFAKIRPNSQLLSVNQQGQKLFTSIEIYPNFNNTGKAYLGGLAITDSPASRGTTQLNFSARNIPDGTQFGAPEEFKFTVQEQESQLDEEQVKRAFSALRRFFSGCGNTKPKVEPTFANIGSPQQQEEFSLTKEELTAAIAAGVTQAFAAQNQAQEPKAQSEPTPKPEEAETVTKKEYNALKAQFDELSNKFNALSTQAVTQTPAGAPESFTAAQTPIF